MLSFRKILLSSMVLLLIGGSGLAFVLFQTLPTLGPRWLFFFFFFVGASGLTLPIISFLNYRFQTNPPVEVNVILRETILIGICSDLLAWLQMGRELTGSLALIIVVGFLLIEFFLRLNEYSRWKPKKDEE